MVVPADHPWARRRRVPLDAARPRETDRGEAGSGLRWCLEQALARAGTSLHELHAALELGSNEAIKEAVLRDLGAAVLSTQPSRRKSRPASCTPSRSPAWP